MSISLASGMSARGRVAAAALTLGILAGALAGAAVQASPERKADAIAPAPTAAAPDEIRDLVDQLDAEAYADRQAATAALMNQREALPVLRQALERDDLSYEQRYRLLLVVEHLIVNTPRGAVGIRVNLRRQPDIVISDLVPGLPAEQVLEIGDQITHVDGERLDQWDRFVEAVQYKSPGERIVLTVRRPVAGPWGGADEPGGGVRPLDQPDAAGEGRDMQTLHIALELGSADDLVDPRTGQPQEGGLVLMRRRAQAADLRDQHLPKPRRVQLASEALAEFARADDQADGRSVDDAAAIQKLRLQQALIQQGQLEINDALRSMWRHELRILREAAAHPHLSDSDRLYLEQVADRYAEITREMGR